MAGLPEWLVAEWDYERNGGLSPDGASAGSTRKVWWRGKCGHEWQAVVFTRTRGHGCPFCSGVKILAGFNDLASTYPDVAKEWDLERNGTMTPSLVSAKTTRRFWWKCSHGHEWQASVASRTNGHGCPYCAGIKAISGVNDLATLFPSVASEWHPTKNGDLKPSDIKPFSNRKVWWRGKCGHEWQAVVCSRTKRGNGCPYCSGHRVLAGFNDLSTTHPDIAMEWDYERNGDLRPDSVSKGCETFVWWRCAKCGFEWRTSPNIRTSQGTGCPKCAAPKGTSFPEQALLMYVRNYLTVKVKGRAKVPASDNDNGQFEIDVFVPALRVGIEYNGVFYHKNRAGKDEAKKRAAESCGIRLIRLIESDANRIEGDDIHIDVRHSKQRNIAWGISSCLALLGVEGADIDLDRDSPTILSQFRAEVERGSLAARFPDIAKEWDYERNGGLRPEEVGYGSDRKVWWVCPACGKSYLKSPKSRTSPGTRDLVQCPNCPTNRGKASRKKVVCIETGTRYGSMTEAAKDITRTVSALTLACKSGSKCAGYHWRYASDEGSATRRRK